MSYKAEKKERYLNKNKYRINKKKKEVYYIKGSNIEKMVNDVSMKDYTFLEKDWNWI